MSHAAYHFIHLKNLFAELLSPRVSPFQFSQNLPFSALLSRPVGAAESSGHSSGEELAGDLGQRGDHDGGLLLESVPGFGQEEGGPDHHRL